MANELKVQKITLDDGRTAERHVSVDDQGNEIVEIFAEEKRPLKLEKRVTRQYKNVVASETHEMVRDGEVTSVEVHTNDVDVPLQLRERIGTVDHAKVVDGDYVRKEDIHRIVADSVVAGVSALMESQGHRHHMVHVDEPVMRAQNIVESNVADKKKSDQTFNIVLAVVLIVQLAVGGYMLFAM